MLSSVANSDAAKVLVIVNKIFFLFIDSSRDNDKKRGVENLWAKTPSQATYFLSIFLCCHIILFCFFHSRSRSRVFLGMIASDSHSRIVGMDFFIPFLFPNFGNGFFHSLPVPEIWE